MSLLRRVLRVRVTQFALLGACVITPQTAFSQSQSTVAIPAADEWTDTGIEFLPGDALGVRAAGEWSNVTGGRFVGQNGYGTLYPGTKLADAPLAALIARIGDSLFRPAVQLSEVTFRGRLSLGMNDVPGTFNDNQGRLGALIFYVQRPAPVPDFTGSTEADAAALLSRYQFVPVVDRGASGLAAGLVYEQVPKTGDLHGVAEVRLYVSTGPAPEPPPPVRSLVPVPDVQGTSAPVGTTISLTAGRGAPWWWLGGLTGIIGLLTTAAWLASRRKPPHPPTLPAPGHFDVALDVEAVATLPSTLPTHGPPIHLRVDLEDGAVRTPALAILRTEVLK